MISQTSLATKPFRVDLPWQVATDLEALARAGADAGYPEPVLA